MRLALTFALVIILVAMLFETLAPRCTASSPRGPAIAGVLRIEGCP